jgi:plasmid stability protein
VTRLAQILVRKLDESVARKLKQRAAKHGRSMEEEARTILRNAVQVETDSDKRGLGTRIAERFKGIELERPVPKLKIKLRIPKLD